MTEYFSDIVERHILVNEPACTRMPETVKVDRFCDEVVDSIGAAKEDCHDLTPYEKRLLANCLQSPTLGIKSGVFECPREDSNLRPTV